MKSRFNWKPVWVVVIVLISHQSFANPGSIPAELARLLSFLKTGRHRLIFMTERGEAYQAFLMRRIQYELEDLRPFIEGRKNYLRRRRQYEKLESLEEFQMNTDRSLSEFLNRDLMLIKDEATYEMIASKVGNLMETRFLLNRFDEVDGLIRRFAPRYIEEIPESFTWKQFAESNPKAAEEIQATIASRFLNPTKISKLTEMLETVARQGVRINRPLQGGLLNPINWAPPLRRAAQGTHYHRHLADEYHRELISYVIRKDGKPIADLFESSMAPQRLKKLAHHQIVRNFGNENVSRGTREQMRVALERDPWVSRDIRRQVNQRFALSEGDERMIRSRGDKLDPISETMQPVTAEDYVISDEALMTTWNIMYRGHRVKESLKQAPITGHAAALYEHAAARIPGVRTVGNAVERATSFTLSIGASAFLKFPSLEVPFPKSVAGLPTSPITRPLGFFNFPRQYRSAIFSQPELSWKTTEFHFEWVLEQVSGLMMLTIANLENSEIIPYHERLGQVAVDVACVFLIDSALVFFLSPRYQYWHPEQYLVSKPIRFNNKLIDGSVGAVARGTKSYLDSLPDSPLQGMTVAEMLTAQHLVPTARPGMAAIRVSHQEAQRIMRQAMRRRPISRRVYERARNSARRTGNEAVEDALTESSNSLWQFYNRNWSAGGFRLDQRLSSYALKAGLFASVGFTSGAVANEVTQMVFDQAYDLATLFDTDAAVESNKEFPDSIKVGKAWANLMAGVTDGSPLPWADTKDGAAYQLGDLPFLMTSSSRYAIAGVVNNRITEFFKTATGKKIRANPKFKSFAFTTLLMPVVKTLGKSKILNRAGRVAAPVVESGMRYGVRFGNNYWGNKIWVMHAANSGIIPKKNPGSLDSVIEYDISSDDFMIDLKEPEDSLIEAWEQSQENR